MYTFHSPIVARFFRLCPIRIDVGGRGALRMELYGCYESEFTRGQLPGSPEV